MTKATLKLLEDNRQTLKSLNDEMNTDVRIADVLEDILSKPEYRDKRARNLDLDDFLALLSEFNQAGIHFAT